MSFFPLIYIMLSFLLFSQTSCTDKNVLINQSKKHHTNNGFTNSHKSADEHGIFDFLKWRYERSSSKLPSLDPKDYSFPILENDGSILRENQNRFSATWIGHATTLIQIDGKNILTDPIWSERCSPVSFAGPVRYTPPGIKMEDLPPIHIVLISHNHYDHLDLPTLKELEKRFSPIFIVGLKNKRLLTGEGIKNVVELDWWDDVSREGLLFSFTPTQHFSARGVFDRNETLWGGYVVSGKKNRFYFSGDTGYFDGFKVISDKFPNIDLAILPIGAYEPRWFMKPVHMNYEDSVKAFIDLKAKLILPMHYQTFILTDEALDEPLKLTKQEFIKNQILLEKFIDLKIGETRFLDEF
jgi:N-acyl-phosphatidylethanolamine-hydrolysing phospholipase D